MIRVVKVKPLRDRDAPQSEFPLHAQADLLGYGLAKSCGFNTHLNYNSRLHDGQTSMAKHLDLEEQEQLAEIKHFWNEYGNLITWAVIVVFGSIAAWNGWQYWQRTQAAQASALYEEVERAAQAGDASRVERAFSDMKDKFGGTTYAQQAGLLAARIFAEKGNTDAAKGALGWVADKASDEGLPGRGAAAPGEHHDGGQGLRRGPQVPVRGLSQGIRGSGGRPARRRVQPAGQEGRGQGRIFKGVQGIRRPGRVPRLVEVKLSALGVDPQQIVGAPAPAASGGAKP